MDMSFTYQSYCDMLDLLKKQGYRLADYREGIPAQRSVILRHDVDTSLDKAVKMARIEAEKGVRSNYFILLTTDFYNAASSKGQQSVRHILELGHAVGLHFDETLYEALSPRELSGAIRREADILSHICRYEISTVSMHRPSKKMLDSDFFVPGMINVYGQTFFKDYKYVSDSRRNWREPVLDIIASGQYDHLHILTHPFWYGGRESDIHDTVKGFVNHANRERYDTFRDNITRLEDIMKESEVL